MTDEKDPIAPFGDGDLHEGLEQGQATTEGEKMTASGGKAGRARGGKSLRDGLETADLEHAGLDHADLEHESLEHEGLETGHATGEGEKMTASGGREEGGRDRDPDREEA